MKAVAPKPKAKTSTYFRTLRKDIVRDWQLHLLMLLPIAYILLFLYWPMYGVQIAFRDFRPKTGITGSAWVGLKWFRKFVSSYNFWEVFTNTITLSLYTLAVGFPIPVAFALLINTVKNEKFKKVVQTISYVPHFISITVIVSIMNLVFSPVSGFYGNFFRLFGGEGYPTDFRGLADSFRHMYAWSGVWQETGWNAIIYTAALSSVSSELHEAAQIDGASRWKRIFHIDLPAILPTVGIMLILRFGSVMSIGFEKAYLMQSSMNMGVSEIISTYIYKVGMGKASDFSYGAAVGLVNSVINCSMLLLVNWITKKISDKEVSLF